jgi:nucleotide-binding universal stress UspA family protein
MLRPGPPPTRRSTRGDAVEQVEQVSTKEAHMAASAGTDRGAAVRRVVVGVDGSPESDLALEAAVGEASRREATLDIRSYWAYPHIPGFTFPNAEVTKAAEDVWDRAMRRAAELDAGLPVTGEVNQGEAASGLVEDSHGAELLVVGGRGAGGFRGLLLGSVGQYCAQHAPCPVLVMRATEQD